MKVGLALGGGSFRGMAHIGVLQVLERYGVPIDLIAGTSVGSLIGGIYACGSPLNMLEKLALSLDMRDYYDVGIPREGFIKGERFLTLARTLTANKDFSQARVPFRAVATDLCSGEKVELSDGKICDAIRASVSIPGIFIPYKIGGRTLCDGGMIDRVPIETARGMGADVVIAVDVGYKGYAMQPEGILEILLHTFDIMDWELTQLHVQAADVLVSPDLRHIDYTSLRDAAECIELGRQEGERVIPVIFEAIDAREKQLREAEPNPAKPTKKAAARKPAARKPAAKKPAAKKETVTP